MFAEHAIFESRGWSIFSGRRADGSAHPPWTSSLIIAPDKFALRWVTIVYCVFCNVSRIYFTIQCSSRVATRSTRTQWPSRQIFRTISSPARPTVDCHWYNSLILRRSTAAPATRSTDTISNTEFNQLQSHMRIFFVYWSLHLAEKC